MASPSNPPPPKQQFKIISSRAQRKQFDSAVKGVIKQRKAVNQLQHAIKQGKQLEKQKKNASALVGEESDAVRNLEAQRVEHLAKLAQLMQAAQLTPPSYSGNGNNSNSGDSSAQGRAPRYQNGGLTHAHSSMSQIQHTTLDSRGRQESRRVTSPALSASLTTSFGSGSSTRGTEGWSRGNNNSNNNSLNENWSGGNLRREQSELPTVSRMTVGRTSRRTFGAVSDHRSAGGGIKGTNRRSSDFDARPEPASLMRKKRPSWNRSASFKSSLNVTDLGDDLDDSVGVNSEGGNKLSQSASDSSDEPGSKQRWRSIASATINGIGTGDKKRRSLLAQDLNIASLGGIAGPYTSERLFSVAASDDDDDNNDGELERSKTDGDIGGIDESIEFGEGNYYNKNGMSRRESYGDMLLTSMMYLPTSNSSKDDQDGSSDEGEGEIEEGEKKMAPTRMTTGDAASQASPKSGEQPRYTVGNSSNNEKPGSTKLDLSNKLGEIDLKDLVPTRRLTVSRENSQKNQLAILEVEEGDNLDDRESPTRRPRQGQATSTNNEEEKEGQWKKQELTEPANVDFSLGASGTSREAGESYEMLTNFSPRSLGPGKQLSMSTSESFATARSRESSHESLPALEIDRLMAGKGSIASDKSESEDDSCPRSQFVLLKSQNKSQSGATGQTQGTSSSSLFSSNGSVTENNPANGTNTPANFEAIKEEDKCDIGESRSNVLNEAEHRERASGDRFEMHVEDGQGLNSYQQRRVGRIKKIRKSIKKSLTGVSSNSSKADDRSCSEVGSHATGSGISLEQQGRVSRHLQRKSSSRSMTSAFSSLSGVTGNSDASTAMSKSSTSSRKWLKLPKGLRRGAGLQKKSKSMYNVSGPPLAGGDGSSRQIMVNHNHERSASNISNLSNRSNVSNLSNHSDDGSYSSSRFTDFYDNSDHVRAVSSLINSKSPSGRSLVTSLATVTEPRHERSDHSLGEGEQKRDEDYHAQQEKKESRASIDSCKSGDTMDSYYRHPSHKHTLVHMRPNQLFPDSPGWQCDECCCETFDMDVWAYVSTEENYLLCESCFSKSGFSVAG